MWFIFPPISARLSICDYSVSCIYCGIKNAFRIVPTRFLSASFSVSNNNNFIFYEVVRVCMRVCAHGTNIIIIKVGSYNTVCFSLKTAFM